MTKEFETKAKAKNKIVTKKHFSTDSLQLHFQCQVKVTLLSTPWTLFKITLKFLMPRRITTTQLFQRMETQILGNMPPLVISSKGQFKMAQG